MAPQVTLSKTTAEECVYGSPSAGKLNSEEGWGGGAGTLPAAGASSLRSHQDREE